MKTAVIGEDTAGVVTYNESLLALLAHYGSAPRACQPYSAKTKGKVERPFRYVRQDVFLGRSFRDLDDLNAQFEEWPRPLPIRVSMPRRSGLSTHILQRKDRTFWPCQRGHMRPF